MEVPSPGRMRNIVSQEGEGFFKKSPHPSLLPKGEGTPDTFRLIFGFNVCLLFDLRKRSNIDQPKTNNIRGSHSYLNTEFLGLDRAYSSWMIE